VGRLFLEGSFFGVRKFLEVIAWFGPLEIHLFFDPSLGRTDDRSVIVFWNLRRGFDRSAGFVGLWGHFDVSLRLGFLKEALFGRFLKFWLRSVSVAAPKAHQPSTARSDTLQSSLL